MLCRLEEVYEKCNGISDLYICNTVDYFRALANFAWEALDRMV